MTTTINDIADLVRILREQPEWADTVRGILLGREVIELPKLFAEFAELTRQNFQLLREQQKADIAEVKADISGVEAEVSGVKTEMDGLKTEVSGLKTEVSSLNVRVTRLEGKMDNALGTNYQNKVVRNLHSILGQHQNLTRVKVLRGYQNDPDADFMEQLYQAEEQGIITHQQSNDLLLVDIICIGRRRDNRDAEIPLAIETSITIGDNDVVRAARRAEILAAILNRPAQAAVIGDSVDQPRTALAADYQVSLILHPDE